MNQYSVGSKVVPFHALCGDAWWPILAPNGERIATVTQEAQAHALVALLNSTLTGAK